MLMFLNCVIFIMAFIVFFLVAIFLLLIINRDLKHRRKMREL